MSCSHCSAAVERALTGVTGVSGVKVDLDGGKATIEGAADVSALIAAVTEEGYTASLAGA